MLRQNYEQTNGENVPERRRHLSKGANILLVNIRKTIGSFNKKVKLKKIKSQNIGGKKRKKVFINFLKTFLF